VANYLDMGSLLDITCARIALFLRDKSVEQIRTFFNVKENFTPDEIAAIQDEQKYLRMEQRLAEKQ
jgi:S-phase kinase-associated protein 1